MIRGGGKLEINSSRFGVSGWNSGFLVLCALDVFNNSDLREISQLNATREDQKKMILEWLITFYADSSINRAQRKILLERNVLKYSFRNLYRIFNGMELVIGEYFGLRKALLKFRMRNKKNLASTKDFIESLVEKKYS